PWEPDAEETVAIRSANHLKVRFIQQSPSSTEVFLLCSAFRPMAMAEEDAHNNKPKPITEIFIAQFFHRIRFSG
ncbi:hypothetical protein, partial [Pantoea agglomerans]|uniref:hypothetical protein n=1 Tax=Enterobacter agglomerans TaxID=549 RepID=UPI001A7E4E14